MTIEALAHRRLHQRQRGRDRHHPHTYTATNLHSLTSGASLNIKSTSVLGKYAERQQQNNKELILIEQYLSANGH